MTGSFECLTAVVLDWAGTTVDHGSCAPAIVFQEVFRRRGVTVTPAQARGPMGMAKRDHIAAIAAVPDVAAAWVAVYGRPCGPDDIDRMYDEFLPLQKNVLTSHSDVIAGVPEAVADCRHMGLRIGSTTGYTRELMAVVTATAATQGYEPDCVLCSEDAPHGRPAPYLLFEAAKRLGVYPMWTVVAVDDTPVGIRAGRNAGCWTVGVTRTGNGVGLSLRDLDASPAEEIRRLCTAAEESLRAAGTHFVVESVADLVPVLREIESQLRAGKSPVSSTPVRF
ncbi:MAG TPA: phosphonoacetaldehyde hydrolase [Fimbriiglobus sp.]|jgi:phosphonoacetaldehyde hydrolase